MAGDVLKEYPAGLDLSDDPGNVGPEVAFVVVPLALSSGAEWLAGIPGKDCVDCAPEWSPVEGGDIVPDWGVGKVSGALGGDDGLPGVILPLDKASGVKAGLCEHEAHIKATGPSAEAEAVSGT